MCKLSIITINYNNLSGLQKTMQSVLSQSSNEFEYIVIDGGSTDGSKEVIEQLAISDKRLAYWVSEPDKGIYNAMNKGIIMAKGSYCQFLNSGDILVNSTVVESMLKQLSTNNYQLPILYGNMLKQMPKGICCDKSLSGKELTMLNFYRGTINHSSAYIKRSLFDTYGLYDENYKIVSDWKWYIQVIIFGNELVKYTDIDVSLFDMNGISTTNKSLDINEREDVLKALLPEKLLIDYKKYAFPIAQWERINRYPVLAKLFYLVERVLFKIEKAKVKNIK